MKIAISGSTGLVGSAVVKYFQQKGFQIFRIVRRSSPIDDKLSSILWDLKTRTIESHKLEGLDAVIHLAGANIADQRWTKKYKEEIYASRVEGTKFLCKALAELKRPPKILLSASAIGYYGAVDAKVAVDESRRKGNDFLAEVCDQWEQATQVAQSAGMNVIHMRLGAVLSSKGGALAKMLLPFQFGLGGKLGSGQQMFSWIALDEIPMIMDHLLQSNKISGPVNVVAPQPVSNGEFTKILGRVLHRPTVMPVPAFGAKLLFGEMADALLLNGAQVIPRRLKESNYSFQYPSLELALRASL